MHFLIGLSTSARVKPGNEARETYRHRTELHTSLLRLLSLMGPVHRLARLQQHLRLEEDVSQGLPEGDLDFENGVVRFVLVLVIALQQVLALHLPRTCVLCQVDLHEPQLEGGGRSGGREGWSNASKKNVM